MYLKVFTYRRRVKYIQPERDYANNNKERIHISIQGTHISYVRAQTSMFKKQDIFTLFLESIECNNYYIHMVTGQLTNQLPGVSISMFVCFMEHNKFT